MFAAARRFDVPAARPGLTFVDRDSRAALTAPIEFAPMTTRTSIPAAAASIIAIATP
jgi:hypothetical protein